MSETYAFCEPSWASTTSREHIRVVQTDGQHFGGGIKNPALCGSDLRGGWDLRTPVEADAVRRGMEAECNPTCAICAGLWLAATSRSTPTPTPLARDEDRLRESVSGGEA